MFNVGSSVIVIASSQKSGTGPRKGSIGFMSSLGQGTIVIENPNYPLICYKTEIAFSRFGYEQSHRGEFKTVLALFPIPLHRKVNDKLVCTVDDLCHKVGSSNKELFKDLEHVMGRDEARSSITVVISPLLSGVVPVNQMNFESKILWIKCILKGEMAHFLYRSIEQRHFTQATDKDLASVGLWDLIKAGILGGSSGWAQLHTTLEHSRQTTQRLVKILTLARVIYEKQNLHNLIHRDGPIGRVEEGIPTDKVLIVPHLLAQNSKAHKEACEIIAEFRKATGTVVNAH